MAVLETEYLLQVDLAYMMAIGALSSHPKADIEKGGANISVMRMDALASIPYMTGGKSGSDVLEEDRQKAIDEWKRRRDAAMRKRPDVTDRKQ
jgi:hypothetical protein